MGNNMREFTSRHRLKVKSMHGKVEERKYFMCWSIYELWRKAWLTLRIRLRSCLQLQHAPQGGGFSLLTSEADAQVVALLCHLGELSLELADPVDALLAILAGGLVVALPLVGGDGVDRGRRPLGTRPLIG